MINYILSFQNTLLSLLIKGIFNKKKKSITKIVVFVSARIGDFIVCLPAIKKIRKLFPDGDIMLICTDSSIKKVSEQTGNNPEWFDFANHLINKKIFVKGTKLLKVETIKNLKKIIADYSPDAVFILDPIGAGFKSKLKKILYLWLIGIRKNVYGTSVFFDLSNKWFRNYHFNSGLIKNIAWGPIFSVLEYTGEKACDFPGYSIHLDFTKISDEVLHLPDNNYAVMFIGGANSIKRLDKNKYIEIISYLTKKNLNVYLIGGSDVKSDADFIEKACLGLKITNLCEKLNLMSAAYLIKNSKIFVGNDSGPAHIANALGIPTIVIENAQNFRGLWWDPNLTKNVVVVRKDVNCSYCNSYPDCPTGTMECINIEVEDIIKAIEKVWNRYYS